MKTKLTLLLLVLCSSSQAVAASSYRVNIGATVLIDEHGVAKNVSNNTCPYDRFVPTFTSTEWSNFRTNIPICMSMTDAYDCAPTTIHSHSLPGAMNTDTATFGDPAGCTYPQKECEPAFHQFTCSGTSWVDNGVSGGRCVCGTCSCF